MAITRAGTAIRLDAASNGQIVEAINIVGFKYIGAAASSATVRAKSASGNICFSSALTTEQPTQALNIRSTGGVHVTMTGTAILYIYIK